MKNYSNLISLNHSPLSGIFTQVTILLIFVTGIDNNEKCGTEIEHDPSSFMIHSEKIHRLHYTRKLKVRQTELAQGPNYDDDPGHVVNSDKLNPEENENGPYPKSKLFIYFQYFVEAH